MFPDYIVDHVQLNEIEVFEPFIAEVGQSSSNHNYTTVNLIETYTNPIVFAGPISKNGKKNKLKTKNITIFDLT